MTGKDEPISHCEYLLWMQYRQKFGFKTDRLEWATANGSAAVANTWGADYKNSDLVPKFGENRKKDMVSLGIALAALPGAQVSFETKDGRILQGKEAVEEFEKSRKKEEGKSKRKKTLDGKPDKKEIKRGKTLSGD